MAGSVMCQTYQNGEAAEDYVPQQVLPPIELWVCRLELAHVLENEVGVHDYSNFRSRQEKARDKPPNLWWELEDLEVVEVEPLNGEYAEVAGD